VNIYTAAITLILVMDPLGNIPVFLSVLAHVDKQRRTRIILRECLFAFMILFLFLFFGDNILKGVGITTQSLNIAGGIILFLIAIKMIFPPENSGEREKFNTDPFIVPLAIPLVAGPSAIATVMLFATQYASTLLEAFCSLLIASTVTTLLLLTAPPLQRVLGEKGLIAVERLMGMILTTIAVQMLLTGITLYFQALK
jgi:multiple antibiotic resistance protein